MAKVLRNGGIGEKVKERGQIKGINMWSISTYHKECRHYEIPTSMNKNFKIILLKNREF